MPHMSPSQYETMTAVVTHHTVIKSITDAYPDASPTERYEMFIGVLDRLARMNGFALRRERMLTDGEDGE